MHLSSFWCTPFESPHISYIVTPTFHNNFRRFYHLLHHALLNLVHGQKRDKVLRVVDNAMFCEKIPTQHIQNMQFQDGWIIFKQSVELPDLIIVKSTVDFLWLLPTVVQFFHMLYFLVAFHFQWIPGQMFVSKCYLDFIHSVDSWKSP